MISRPILAGRYELGPLLGGGGMGAVYRAWDRLLGREVALKILRPEHAGSREFVTRFEREAKNAASLSHPNIVRVFDAGEAGDGTRYIAMECIPGGTLADLIRKEGVLAPRAAIKVLLQLAAALSYAHGRGIVHRDVKPQNVLMTDEGDARMADFGIAWAAEATVLTRADMVVGSVGYLSPEQARGEPVDHRTDLYALGVVLYEMLTGSVPFVAESPIAVAMKHATQPPPSPSEANPAVPLDLAGVTLKLLSKDPSDRYASAGSLMADLERLQEGRPLPEVAALASAPTPVQLSVPAAAAAATTVLPGRVATMVRSRRRRRRIAGVAAALCGLAALAVGPLALGEGRIGGEEPETTITRSLAPSVAALPGAPEEATSSPRASETPAEPAGTAQVPAASASAQASVSVSRPRDDVAARSAQEPENRGPRASAVATAGRIERLTAGVSSPTPPKPPDADTPVVGTSDGEAEKIAAAAIEASRD